MRPDQRGGRSLRVLLAAEEIHGVLGSLEAGDLWRLSNPDIGVVVTDHRSSWVRLRNFGVIGCFCKTYDYPTWRDRLRGAFRNTLCAPSRAEREASALAWLLGHGFPAPRPLLVVEWRRAGFLTRALLVTEAWPGTDLGSLLPALPEPERSACIAEVQAHLERLLASGYRDPNFVLRNILARRDARGCWEFAKVDAPRFVARRSGPATDRAALRTRASLAADLARLPPAPPAERAAQKSDGSGSRPR